MQYTFTTNPGEDHASYTDFISYIRASSSNTKPVDRVKIIFTQEGADPIESPWIAMDAKNFYLTGLSVGKDFTTVTYSSSDVNLNFFQLYFAILELKSALAHKRDPNEDTLKTLAFFISEAVRFEIIEHACYCLLKDESESYSWSHFSGLVHNWTKLASYEYIHPHVRIPKGSRVIPLTIEMTQANLYEGNLCGVEPSKKLAHFIEKLIGKPTNHLNSQPYFSLSEFMQSVESKYQSLMAEPDEPDPNIATFINDSSDDDASNATTGALWQPSCASSGSAAISSQKGARLS